MDIRGHVTVNISDRARIKLTARGAKIWNERVTAMYLQGFTFPVRADVREGEEIETPLHFAMIAFGPYMQGMPLFEGGDLVFSNAKP